MTIAQIVETRQSLSPTVLFRTTHTRTITPNKLLNWTPLVRTESTTISYLALAGSWYFSRVLILLFLPQILTFYITRILVKMFLSKMSSIIWMCLELEYIQCTTSLIAPLNASAILPAAHSTWPHPKEPMESFGASCCLLRSTVTPRSTREMGVRITFLLRWGYFSSASAVEVPVPRRSQMFFFLLSHWMNFSIWDCEM